MRQLRQLRQTPSSPCDHKEKACLENYFLLWILGQSRHLPSFRWFRPGLPVLNWRLASPLSPVDYRQAKILDDAQQEVLTHPKLSKRHGDGPLPPFALARAGERRVGFVLRLIQKKSRPSTKDRWLGSRPDEGAESATPTSRPRIKSAKNQITTYCALRTPRIYWSDNQLALVTRPLSKRTAKTSELLSGYDEDQYGRYHVVRTSIILLHGELYSPTNSFLVGNPQPECPPSESPAA